MGFFVSKMFFVANRTQSLLALNNIAGQLKLRVRVSYKEKLSQVRIKKIILGINICFALEKEIL